MTDIIVIGGGMAGLSAAARLAPLGRVTVLEREEALTYHASGRSAAVFEENYGLPSTIALNRASRAFHQSAGVLSPRGLMLVAKADEAQGFAADCDAMRLTEIDIADARARVPVLRDDVARAALDEDAWDIDTHRLAQQFSAEITRHGGQIVLRAEVTRIARVRQGWEVHTVKHGLIGAKMIVNAAGAWADEVARMARVRPVGLTPLRRSMGRIPVPEGLDAAAWPILFGPGESWYMKPDAGALIVSPADEDPQPPMDAWADDMVLAEGFARMEGYCDLAVTRLLASWAGLRTFAPDRNLVIGAAPDDPAFWWCAGQGGYGIQSAPAYSALLADLVAGRSPAFSMEVIRALSPARFSAGD